MKTTQSGMIDSSPVSLFETANNEHTQHIHVETVSYKQVTSPENVLSMCCDQHIDHPRGHNSFDEWLYVAPKGLDVFVARRGANWDEKTVEAIYPPAFWESTPSNGKWRV